MVDDYPMTRHINKWNVSRAHQQNASSDEIAARKSHLSVTKRARGGGRGSGTLELNAS